MITPETGGRIRGIQITVDAAATANIEVDESPALLKQIRADENATLIGSWRQKTGNSLHMIESFFHAFHGIWVGLKEERNLRIHFLAAAVVVAAGMWFKLDVPSWIALILTSGLVLVTEFLNTALEHLVDLASEGRYFKSARYAKDTAAAAVLCASITAAVVGGMVFLPHIKLW
jgi:undecaprenol kinase